MISRLPPARRKLSQSIPFTSLTLSSCPRYTNHQRRHSSHPSSPTPTARQPSPSQQPQIIFSGIQPTGTPHLGNYLGALLPWVKLSKTASPDAKLFFSVVDLHAITASQNPAQLREWRREMVRVLCALGLAGDGEYGGRGDWGSSERGGGSQARGGMGGSMVFVQSHVKQHAELMWILSCTTSMGYLGRMTQWKSKLDLKDDASPLDERKGKLKLGLFSYPVLQAADILVHRATHVPVGEDQSQHLEFARECVTNFNHTYGPTLVYPQTLLSPAKRIMSLTNPLKKMSKSDPSPSSRILITDTPETIQKKLTTAVTDSLNSVSWDPVNRPGVSNLLTLLSAFDEEGRTAEELGSVYGTGMGLGAFKKLVGEAIGEGLRDVRVEYERVSREGEGFLVDVERRGARVAGENAKETMVSVREAVGL